MIIAGTGHRPDKLGGYSDDVLSKLIKLARTTLFDLKPKKVISGMALGWDMALAYAALALTEPEVVAAIPFLGQEKMWPKESQERYHTILKDCDDVLYICDQGYAAWKMQIRNEYMVDHCDLVLALWDGSPGGTANCIAYANKKNKPIMNLWNDWSKDN